MGSILNSGDRTAIQHRIGLVTSASVPRWGRMDVAPFPKSAPTAPELLVSEAGTVDAIRSDLVSLVERIGAGPRDGRGPVHPLFGRLSRSEEHTSELQSR